ncbi:hypothetical protein B0J13DRAFT_208153 [Dactylonectria estremocensis]|uniref:Uncharacterized protein n=1 Tax=Dactylonectria estremocensis TaxID=1079267 RepID=A0A9P9DAN2_9HYPO|nr:hypothetical protein B0J13DRAFT_208153 [Dactylonectria estremocensis]
MAHTHQYSFCTVCGIPIAEYFREEVNGPSCWNAHLWESNAVLLTGPHTEQGPESMKVSPDSVTRRLAVATYIDLHTIPDGERVFPQLEDYLNHHRISFCIHSACDTIADRVIETSPTAHIRSIGELWMTLERRCTKTSRDVPNCFDNFLPEIPEKNPSEPSKLGLGRYYVQLECFWEDPPSGWWNHDPLHIPDLTTALISNLEQVHVASSPFASTFASLPREIVDIETTTADEDNHTPIG